jgi:hypothetical protein
MEELGAVIRTLHGTLGVPGLLIGLFHPVWSTILVALLVWWRLRRTDLWRERKRLILIGAGALYAIDAAIALPRIVYAWRSPDHGVVHQRTELPAKLVLVNAACDKTCHALLQSGAIEEVILVKTDQPEAAKAPPPRRYRAGWSRPGACPEERQDAIGYGVGRAELLRDGFCPQVEPAEIPTEGIFVVQESLYRGARQKAVALTSTYVVDAPPGSMIRLSAIEVQRRTRDRIEVLAERRRYLAPGVLGLPPLVGCWVRLDNVLGIYPPGDTGCGLWRWFTSGGDHNWSGDVAWVYAGVFTPAARPATPPPRPDLPPASSSDALEILSRATPIDDYLPALKDKLVDPSVSDDALIHMVAQRVLRRRALDGALIAVLARERPEAAVRIPVRLGPPPAQVTQSGLILAEMERDRAIFDAWSTFMFDALASDWDAFPSPPNPARAERLLALLRERDPEFLCQRLDRITRRDGLLDHRRRLLSRHRGHLQHYETMPDFLRPLINAAVSQCGERANGFLRNLLTAPAAARREGVALFISRLPSEVASQLSDQAFANLLDEDVMDARVYATLNRRQHYAYAHLQVLISAGQSCDDVARKFDAAVAALRAGGGTPSPQLLERLAYLERRDSHPPDEIARLAYFFQRGNPPSLKCELR